MASAPSQGQASEYYSQQYQQQPPKGGPPPPPYGQEYGGQQQQQPQQGGVNEKQSFNQAFTVQRPKWNDVWAGILFLIVVCGFAAVSAISINGYSKTRNLNGNGIGNGSNTFGLTTDTIILLCFCLAAAFVLSYGYIWLARIFTKTFIWVTGILNIAIGLATSIYMLYRGYYSGGIVFLLFSVFTLICFISWIPRIPFSVLMLQTSIDVSKNYGHVYLVSLLGGLAGVAFAAWYSVTMVAVYIRFQPGNAQTPNPNCSQGGCSTATVTGLLVFITFAGYWISEWLKNTIHTTISGVYGSWYFCSHSYPRAVTGGALKRSLTYSFGSISLGSLIVAIINFLRQMCSIAQQQAGFDNNPIGAALWCVLGCLISILDWAVQFINRYAFSHIALYGKSYFAAAKDTWKMIKDRGIDALVNECLVGPVLSMGATFVAYACALIAYLYLVLKDPAYNQDGAYTPVVVAFAFLIGLQICNVFTTPLGSGIDTIFVAAAWDPEVLMRDHPDLYQRMVQVYPHVQQAIHA